MPPVSIIRMPPWKIAAIACICFPVIGSIWVGWYLGGLPNIYWSMERERLHALAEYSQMVRVGYRLVANSNSRLPRFDGVETDARNLSFTVYIIGYGEGAVCSESGCDLTEPLVTSWGGTTVMIQDIERARSFGVRAVVDERGEHLADRLIVVTDTNAMVKGIFRNIDSQDLDAALRYSLRRQPRRPSTLTQVMKKLHAWGSVGIETGQP